MAGNTVLELVNPILLKVCNYYTFRKYGYEVKYENVVEEIHSLFSDIKRKTQENELLNNEYKKIEKPLVFFVDYILKESDFSFSQDYQIMARLYNELSGDDKFFDLLEQALKDPNCDDQIIEVYYLMLGLGFDGAYKRDPKEVIKIMYDCSDRLNNHIKTNSDILFPEIQPNDDHVKEKKFEDKFFSLNKKSVLLSLAGVWVICFIVNLVCIYSSTSKFTTSVQSALEAASPFNNLVVIDENNINEDETEVKDE